MIQNYSEKTHIIAFFLDGVYSVFLSQTPQHLVKVKFSHLNSHPLLLFQLFPFSSLAFSSLPK